MRNLLDSLDLPFSSPLFRPPSLSRQKWKINSTTKWGEDEESKRRGGESARARNENIVGEEFNVKNCFEEEEEGRGGGRLSPNCPPQFPHPAITPYVDRRGGCKKVLKSLSLSLGVLSEAGSGEN